MNRDNYIEIVDQIKFNDKIRLLGLQMTAIDIPVTVNCLKGLFKNRLGKDMINQKGVCQN